MNNDDLDDDLSLDESFDDFEKKSSGSTLGDLWRDNPAFKIGSIVGGVVFVFVLISFLGGEDQAVKDSYVGTSSDITSTPGTEEASPAYVQAIEELNEADIERAISQGDSSLPVPVDPPVGIVSLPNQVEEVEDPLQRWRRLQEERLEREVKQRRNTLPEQEVTVDTSRQEAVQKLSDAMIEQMSSILEARPQFSVSSMQLSSPDFLAQLKAEEEAEAAKLAEEVPTPEPVSRTLVPAGEIVYAQLLTEANTDSPGPVLAQIMSGPLKGSRILGTFQEQEELLTLNFDTVVYKEESIGINAVGLDPETTLPGMATDVDHRYFKRILLPAAASFVQGFAGAIGKTATVAVATSGGGGVESEEEPESDEEVALGVEEAGSALSDIISELANDTEVLVRIEAGTPIGLLFTKPVIVGDNI